MVLLSYPPFSQDFKLNLSAVIWKMASYLCCRCIGNFCGCNYDTMSCVLIRLSEFESSLGAVLFQTISLRCQVLFLSTQSQGHLISVEPLSDIQYCIKVLNISQNQEMGVIMSQTLFLDFFHEVFELDLIIRLFQAVSANFYKHKKNSGF